MSESLLTFLVLCLVVELTPGPNMAYLALLSLSAGKRAGIAAVAGVALGLLVVGGLAALGVATLVATSAFLAQLLVVVGACYLFWLAWRCWHDVPEQSPEDIYHAHEKYFVRGLVMNLLNPKAFIFYAMVLPGFVVGYAYPLGAALMLTLLSVGIATMVHLLIVLLGGRLQPYFAHPNHYRRLRQVMALMLVAIALWFVIENASLLFK